MIYKSMCYGFAFPYTDFLRKKPCLFFKGEDLSGVGEIEASKTCVNMHLFDT